MIIKVLSYNILMDYFADPNYIKVKKKYLDNKYRIILIIKKLLSELKKNTIICLQEVGNSQLNILIKIFYNLGYYCININELCIFFPYKKFNIKNINLGIISDLKYNLPKKFHELLISKKKYFIILELKDKKTKKKITIVNTHLLANPKYEQIKFLQTYVILRELEKYKNIILCGDLNSLPTSDVVKFILHQKISTKLKNIATGLSGQAQPLATGLSGQAQPLANIYKPTHNHSLITTHTKNKLSGIFTEMIDYIFVSKNIKIINISKLNDRSDYNSKNIAPNKHEPSDHFLISTTLNI